jgi:hypothetical protein
VKLVLVHEAAFGGVAFYAADYFGFRHVRIIRREG